MTITRFQHLVISAFTSDELARLISVSRFRDAFETLASLDDADELIRAGVRLIIQWELDRFREEDSCL